MRCEDCKAKATTQLMSRYGFKHNYCADCAETYENSTQIARKVTQ